MVWRTNKGNTDPNSPDNSKNPMTDPGHKHTAASSQIGGSNTSASAVVTSPTFVSTVAQVLNATYDANLYVEVKTAASLTITMGPTTGSENTILATVVAALGLETIHVPAGWSVIITGTVADLAITAITC
jgi:hypothetical protein